MTLKVYLDALAGMTTNANAAARGDLVDHIRQLIYDCGPDTDRHDHALVAITTCISAGVNTKREIIGLLARCGFKPGHIAIVLNPKKGPFANADHWRLDAGGRYHPPRGGAAERLGFATGPGCPLAGARVRHVNG